MRKLVLVPIAFAIASLAGCATTGDGYYGSTSSYGSGGYYPSHSSTSQMYGTVASVESVQMARGSSGNGIGAGAVIGALIGGAVGNQIGSGGGRTAATIGGAVAGGYIGDRIQDSNHRDATWGQQIQVRLDNGQYVTIVQPGTSVYSGARVYVSGYGSSARVNLMR